MRIPHPARRPGPALLFALALLLAARPAQIDAWVENNVTTLAGVRAALKLVIKILIILARRELRTNN